MNGIKRSKMRVGRNPLRGSERGMALILCIGFLGILSLLGVVVLNLTERGLGMSGQDKQNKDIFFTADRAVEFFMSPRIFQKLDVPGDTVNIMDDACLDCGENSALRAFIETGDADLISGFVTYRGFGGAPSNAAKYDKSASAGKVYRYFQIEVETRRPGIGTEPVKIDALLVQAFPAQSNVPVTKASGKAPAPGLGGN